MLLLKVHAQTLAHKRPPCRGRGQLPLELQELQEERLVSFMGALLAFMPTGYCRYCGGGGGSCFPPPVLRRYLAFLVQVQGLQVGLAVEEWQVHQGKCSPVLWPAVLARFALPAGLPACWPPGQPATPCPAPTPSHPILPLNPRPCAVLRLRRRLLLLQVEERQRLLHQVRPRLQLEARQLHPPLQEGL